MIPAFYKMRIGVLPGAFFKFHIILFSEINIFTYLENNLQSNLQFRLAEKEKDDIPLCEKFYAKLSISNHLYLPCSFIMQ